MKRVRSALLVLLILLAISLVCASTQADQWSYAAAKARAESAERIAWVYGSAIVIAGIAIGAGIFFGLRSTHSKNRDE